MTNDVRNKSRFMLHFLRSQDR